MYACACMLRASSTDTFMPFDVTITTALDCCSRVSMATCARKRHTSLKLIARNKLYTVLAFLILTESTSRPDVDCCDDGTPANTSVMVPRCWCATPCHLFFPRNTIQNQPMAMLEKGAKVLKEEKTNITSLARIADR